METVIYIGVIALVAVSLSSFAITIASSKSQTYDRAEIQDSTRMALEIISDKIRSATDIDTGGSVFGSDTGRLVLNPGSDPMIVYLDSGSGRIAVEQGGAPVFITSGNARVTSLMFENRTSGTRKNIFMKITVEQKAASARPNYSYTLTMSVSVRSDQ